MRIEEPLAKTFTKDELIERARKYAREKWTVTDFEGCSEIPVEYKKRHDRDLLAVCVFIFDLFDEPPTPNPPLKFWGIKPKDLC